MAATRVGLGLASINLLKPAKETLLWILVHKKGPANELSD